MGNSSTIARPHPLQPHLPDDVTVKHWVAIYAVYFLSLAVPLAWLLTRTPWNWSDWTHNPAEAFAATHPAIKLLVFALYLSVCTTLLPLPTGWLAAGVATHAAAVGPDVWTTTLIVATVGAAGSTMANLNDYHLFTWLLRHHRIAAVRATRPYQAAARWFAHSPFFLLFVFNVIPIPIDLVRMLAISYRYPRVSFAAANFTGRWVRYAVIAFVTYYWSLGWYAAAALLGISVLFGLGHVYRRLAPRLLARAANQPTIEVSIDPDETKEPEE